MRLEPTSDCVQCDIFIVIGFLTVGIRTGAQLSQMWTESLTQQFVVRTKWSAEKTDNISSRLENGDEASNRSWRTKTGCEGEQLHSITGRNAIDPDVAFISNCCWHKAKIIHSENITLEIQKRKWLWRVIVFCDVTLCGLMKVKWRFGGTYRLHNQGRIVKQATNQHEAGSKQSSASLTLKADAICFSETSDSFRTTWCCTAVRTPNPTKIACPWSYCGLCNLVGEL
jgi:hypothetical protein